MLNQFRILKKAGYQFFHLFTRQFTEEIPPVVGVKHQILHVSLWVRYNKVVIYPRRTNRVLQPMWVGILNNRINQIRIKEKDSKYQKWSK